MPSRESSEIDAFAGTHGLEEVLRSKIAVQIESDHSKMIDLSAARGVE